MMKFIFYNADFITNYLNNENVGIHNKNQK